MIKNGRGEKLEGTGIIKDVFNYVKGQVWNKVKHPLSTIGDVVGLIPDARA